MTALQTLLLLICIAILTLHSLAIIAVYRFVWPVIKDHVQQPCTVTPAAELTETAPLVVNCTQIPDDTKIPPPAKKKADKIKKCPHCQKITPLTKILREETDETKTALVYECLKCGKEVML